MFTRASAFNQFRSLFAPRKPRHPLVRVAVGLLGLAWKLLASRKTVGARRAADANVVEGEYRVVRKSALPMSR